MSDYRINFNGMSRTQDTMNLAQILDIIDNGDKLTIIVENNSTRDMDTESIIKLLDENGFNCTTNGGPANNNFYIIANRVDRKGFEGIH
jgi:hypothetical protein